ncbi:energy-coupling factor transport system substrate-specific component [Atopostipes suicloacalis DSM 15692]|uniref:Energy-coupling factor transport system substrate-specific component n=1 Tax=Atopostipes suicloacalis DSM 15692 TaxID=1121025 RepID=A0A1M4XZA0_9LACT|nr:MptD family putative ECF transporter S component [Atopostipes suicloacalis]SHE98765.1 energy-coupling factor transport system substrate-specific component [Atopostipes suicloacalis DSM 15692]
MSKKKKIQIKDLVTIGVYTALYFIMVAISALLVIFIIPGYSYVFIPVISALLSGTIFMLMVAKVPRFGAITIMGSIMGIFFFIMGRFPGALFICIVIAFIADGIAYLMRYKNKKGLLLSYLIFSFSTIGPVIPMFIFPTVYINQLIEVGHDATYIEGVFNNISQNTLSVLIGGIIVAAIVGGLFGQKMMNKHFEKAGIV